MTPSFRWVFLLALVGRAASVPDPVVVDACALLCNPGAETESERARDPKLYPRYPKVNCHPQSVSDDDQAWRIASHCLKLCNEEPTVEMEVNCFALRSSLGSNLGCYCEALTPLSPNTMRLHESWRLNFLVKELAKDIMDVILDSPLDMMILCEIHSEIYNNYELKLPESGRIIDICKNDTMRIRPSRSVDEDALEDGVDIKAEEELTAEEENKDRVTREIENSKSSENSFTKYNDMKFPGSKENEFEDKIEKKKSPEKDTGLGKKDEAKNNQKIEKDITDDSEDNVKGNVKKESVKHSKNSKEDSKNDGKRDNAKDNVSDNKDTTSEAKSNLENDKKSTTSDAKDNVEKDKKDTKSDALNVAQDDKKVKEDTTNNNKQSDVKDNAKNAAKDNAKDDKKDSKTESEKDNAKDQAENNAKNDEERDKRGTKDDNIDQDYTEFNGYDMLNDEAYKPQEDATEKEVLDELEDTARHLLKLIKYLQANEAMKR